MPDLCSGFSQPICRTCTWSRRPSTQVDRALLGQAFSAHIGEPIVDRIARLSGPLESYPRTAEGHIVEKHLAWQNAGEGDAVEAAEA